MAMLRGINSEVIILPKGFIKNYDIIINEKNFYDLPINSYVKRYEKIKLTTGKD